jgi:aminocarboxymuconate-semialdehyde decarboxylase
MVLDIHCHMAIRAADEHFCQCTSGGLPSMPFTSEDSQQVYREMFGTITSRLFGIDDRIADMDRLGIDIQAISPSPGQYFYFTLLEMGRDLVRLVNDGIAAAVAKQPDRLIGLGTAPLQSTEFTITEMQRCVRELGFRGIEINSNVNGRDLSHPDIRTFFAAAEELGVMLFLHPLGFTQGERLVEHYLNNLVGNPLESTLALSHLIFGGVLENYPGLKICVAHRGGFLPAYRGRMDHAWRVRPDCRRNIPRPPSDYLRKLWFDTLVFDPQQLDALIAAFGHERLCLGTDYPFDMSAPDPVGFHMYLTETQQAAILGGNAAALLGLEQSVNQGE